MEVAVLKQSRVPGRRPGAAEREELLRLWGAPSHDGWKVLLFVARTAAVDERLPPPGSSLFPGKTK